MTEQSTNVLLSAGHMLLDEQERAFIVACNTVCVIADSGDGWPGLKVIDPASAAIEVVNSQSLRLRLDPALAAEKKLALLLMRHSDGRHLIIHGHVASSPDATDGERRSRICVASRSWSPEIGGRTSEAVLARALHRL